MYELRDNNKSVIGKYHVKDIRRFEGGVQETEPVKPIRKRGRPKKETNVKINVDQRRGRDRPKKVK